MISSVLPYLNQQAPSYVEDKALASRRANRFPMIHLLPPDELEDDSPQFC